MVLINTHNDDIAIRSFEAEIWNIAGKDSKPISLKYQPLINITPVAQSVKILKVVDKGKGKEENH